MISRIREYIEKQSVENKIVIVRFSAGLALGIGVFVASIIVPPAFLSPFAWAASVFIYYLTGVYAAYKYGPLTRFQLYLRGLATFYGTWLITAILLYELTSYLGLRH